MSSRLAIVLLVGTALLAYANSVGGGWVWDDYPLIVQKRAFYGDPANIPSALISPDRALPESGTSYYRPLAALNYFADRAVFGVEPAGYQLESVDPASRSLCSSGTCSPACSAARDWRSFHSVVRVWPDSPKRAQL